MDEEEREAKPMDIGTSHIETFVQNPKAIHHRRPLSSR
jgi:hypothetical protein